ncbi:hypothetical protein ACLOJK_021214 [Asimina triloba]
MAAALSSAVESCTVETPDGAKLHARLFKPPNEPKSNLVIVLVHPYSVLGGCQALLRGIGLGLAEMGWKAVTFDMRGAGRSTGRPSLTGSAEIRDVIAVCNWAAQYLSADRIVLVGSSAGLLICSAHWKSEMMVLVAYMRSEGFVISFGYVAYLIGFYDEICTFELYVPCFSESGTLCALTCNCGIVILMSDTAVEGAPISGSAVDQVEQVVGYVSIGYPFGWTASILFGRHHKAILQSPKPKLFIMGTNDGFTSVKQLENKLKSAAGRVETHLIQGVGHFQMEGPAFDEDMVNLIIRFVETL